MTRGTLLGTLLLASPSFGSSHAKHKPAHPPAAGHRHAAKPERPAATEVAAREPEAAAHPEAASASAPAPAAAPATHGPTRLDFDDRLIQGQHNAAGAVYLYDRKELPLTPMVSARDTFLQAAVTDLFGEK